MNLLVTGAWQCTNKQLELIEALGHRVFYLQDEKASMSLPYEAVEGVICNSLFLYHQIEKFTNLRYIQLTSAGFDRAPMEYILLKGITIHNAWGVYSIPMAEFALCGVLQIYKKRICFAQNQADKRWKKCRDLLELYEKNVCIIGCGSVGTECAKRFLGFGCNVVGIARHPQTIGYFDKILPLHCLEESLAEADIVVLALPLTENSYHMIGERQLARLKEGAVLVNLARGAIVDTQALIPWLEDKRGAAVLDVFEEEPLPVDSPLWQMENVIVTPHNSFVGEGNAARLFAVIKNNLGKQ